MRLDRGKNPPQSCITEIYKVLSPASIRAASTSTPTAWCGPRWRPAAMASFDRRKCKADHRPAQGGRQRVRGLDAVSDAGPEAEGHQHPGRLPLLQLGGPAQHPRPRRQQADGHRLELGFDLVLDPQTRRWVTLRVPYPLGFSRGSTAASTIPTAAGRGARSTPTTARTSCGTSKAARDQGQAGEVPGAARSAGALRRR